MINKESLIKEIEKHNHLYWIDNNPELLDEEYDILKLKLKSIDPNHSLLSKVDIQKSKENINKYQHKEPMLSLEKFYSKEEVFKWMKSVSRNSDEKFRFELKLDGCSGKRENGHLATRGDGFLGEDHTDKISYIKFLGCNSEDNYVGELIIKEDFFNDNLKKEGYKTPRNAVSGIMGNKNPEKIKDKGILFVNYDYDKITRTCTLEDLEKNWDKWKDEFLNLKFPYDGLVIKLADKEYYKQLGNKTNTPRGAIAYKFANKSAITKIKDIVWQVSRIGKLTPVVELESVELSGVTISRATAHNLDFIISKNLKIGSSVIIERAGDVIPKIIETISTEEKLQEIDIPKYCPCCGESTKVNGVDLVCINKNCPDRLIENICFISNILEIEELGRPTAEKMFNHPVYQIYNVLDLYQFTYEDILSFDGFGEKSAKTLYDNIHNSLNNITEVLFLSSFGISGIGKTITKKILNHYKGLENLFNEGDFYSLIKIDGIGEKLAFNLISSLKEIKEIYYRYCKLIVIPKKENYENNNKYKICFTGKGDFGRGEYAKIAKDKGYEPINSVTNDLSILVTNDPESNSSKMKKARKNGTKIISYQEFMSI